MVSDVPVGAFLSAGLESSSIVAMMRKATNQPVRTYTITFPYKDRVGETTLDDPEVAARCATQLGCENQRIVVEPDIKDLLPRLIWHMDEPTADPAIITAYLVCREARKQSTVLLSGVGGDELFAGYRKHLARRWAQAYQTMPQFARSAFEAVLSSLPSMRGTALKGTIRLAKKMVRSASFEPVDQFIANCTYLDQTHKSKLYQPEFAFRVGGLDAARVHRSSFSQVAHADFLNQMLYVDTKIFMTALNLTYNDKMSMASSVEVRVPFLDRELAEFAAWNIAPDLKIKGFLNPETKYIFRRAMQGALPQEVLRQPKAGFAAPVDYWLAHDLREMVDDLLSPSAITRRGFFKPEVIRRFVDEQRNGRHDWSMQLWQFLTLEIWMQTFLDAHRVKSSAYYVPRMASA
jgi:asparagine synthase (glutamine-hydrolysing)